MYEKEHWNSGSNHALGNGSSMYCGGSAVCELYAWQDAPYSRRSILRLPSCYELVPLVPDYWEKYMPSRVTYREKDMIQ